ncbi:MAG: hypothetical protein V1676_07180 [Candidatus Diapherotrites archaeon]
MFNALFGSAWEIVRKPAVLIPAAVVTAINLVLAFLAMDFIMGFFWNTFMAGVMPEGSFIELPYMLFAIYWKELLVTGIVIVLQYALWAWLVFAYTGMKKTRKESLGEGVAYATSRLGSILWLSVFVTVLFLAFVLAGMFLLWISTVAGLELIGLVLTLLLTVLAAYVSVKLLFVPAAMAAHGLKPKKGMQQTWRWSAGKLPGILLFLVLLLLFNGIISVAGDAASALAAGNEIAEVAVLALFSIIGGAYFSIALASYYLGTLAKKRKRK